MTHRRITNHPSTSDKEECTKPAFVPRGNSNRLAELLGSAPAVLPDTFQRQFLGHTAYVLADGRYAVVVPGWCGDYVWVFDSLSALTAWEEAQQEEHRQPEHHYVPVLADEVTA